MLLEDLIITDTSKENVFELQEKYPTGISGRRRQPFT